MNYRLLRSACLVVALAALSACGGDPEPTAATPVAAPSDTPSPSPAPTPMPDPAPTPAPLPVTSATVPVLFHGEWNLVLADCGTDKSDSRLRIAADKIIFDEDSASVVQATQEDSDLQVIVQLTVEGEIVERRHSYRLARNRQALTDLGTGQVRLRCVFRPKDASQPPPAQG